MTKLIPLPRGPEIIPRSDFKQLEGIRVIILPIFIIFLGTISIIGFQMNITSLYILGLATVASPVPLPFSDYKNNQENFAYQYILYVTDKTETHTFQASSLQLQGPHKQKISFISSIILSPLQIPLYKKALFVNICQKNNVLLSTLNLHQITSVVIDIKSSLTNSHEFSFITCYD